MPLPPRWLSGFAEVALVGAAVRPVVEVSPVQARRFLSALPAAGGTRDRLWAVPAGAGLRLTGRPGAGAVPIGGAERLRVLEPLLRFATRLRAHAAPADATAGVGASVWELELPGARCTVTLSPGTARGFSGEGGTLRDLVGADAAEDAAVVARFLRDRPHADTGALSAVTGLGEEQVRRAATWLGTAGSVGFDVHEGAWFHRVLPYDPAALAAAPRRLRSARALADRGAVSLHGDGVAHVRSGTTEYVVRSDGDRRRCSCTWYLRHGGERGPCKHVLAVDQVLADLPLALRPDSTGAPVAAGFRVVPDSCEAGLARLVALADDPADGDALAGVVIEVMAGLPARHRAALSAAVADLAAEDQFDRDGVEQMLTFGLAVLGCVTGLRAAREALDAAPLPRGTEAAGARVLRHRAPSWLPGLPGALFRRPHPYAAVHVRLVRALVRAGLVPPPDHPQYAEQLVSDLTSEHTRVSLSRGVRHAGGIRSRHRWRN